MSHPTILVAILPERSLHNNHFHCEGMDLFIDLKILRRPL